MRNIMGRGCSIRPESIFIILGIWAGLACSQSLTDILPTSQASGRTWKYTLTAPPADWNTSGFSDDAWTGGPAGFGTEGTPGAVIRTVWNTADIWLRQSFNPGPLTRDEINSLVLKIHHDEDAEIYINGVSAASLGGWSTAYTTEALSQNAKDAIVSDGDNLIAIHCRQATGGQYIDAGLAMLVPDTAMNAALLGPHLDKIRKVVFTKHYDLGGSHYAYTEGMSDAENERTFTGGSSLCLFEIDDNHNRTVTTLLNDPNGVIRDPEVSFDGKRILFAWKKSDRGDDYHLYEMDAETRDIRQLTDGLGFADYEGSYLPNGNIVFSSTRAVQIVDCWWTEVSNLFLMDGDGHFMRRIGFDQVHTNYPKVMPDGKVTYTRWEYNDRGQLYPQPLFVMNPDGTGQTEYYGNNSWFPTTIMHARGIPGTGKVLAVLSGHHTHQQGKLAIVNPAMGRQENSGITMLAPIHRLQDTIKVDAWGQSGDQWQYPYPFDEDNYLVAFRPDGSPHFKIYFMNSAGERVLLASDDNISCSQPVPLVPRDPPSQYPEAVDYSVQTGIYTMENIYIGPGLKGVVEGSIKKLRVVSLLYRASGLGSNGNDGPAGFAVVSTPLGIRNTSWDPKIILGEADVYEDGSAAFYVPARTPVYFQAVDGNGHVVQTMRSWSTLQPGETFSCVGCHEDKNETVPAMPLSTAMKNGPQALAPFYDASGKGFSYPQIIQPIWDAKCVSCHAGANGIDLQGTGVRDNGARKTWNQSYLSLVGTHDAGGNEITSKHVSWLNPQSVPTMLPPNMAGASRSPLIGLLDQGHYDVTMTREEMDKIAAWIDLLVPHAGDYTEGMSQPDKDAYEQKLQKRLDWQAQEAHNIEAMLAANPVVPGGGGIRDSGAQGGSRFILHLPGSPSQMTFERGLFGDGGEITFYDLSGKLVHTLPAVGNSVRWDGHGARGQALDNGFYFVRFKSGTREMTRKTFLIR